MVAHCRSEELAEGLPVEWRAAFVRFVETGEAEQGFLDFLETDKPAQEAVEVMFNETAAAFERLGAFLRSAKSDSVRVGDKMPDGTIYAGLSPDTGQPMYTTPRDAPLTYTFNEAGKYAEKLDAYGYDDWHVPTKGELNVLRENRNEGALEGTFNVTGSLPASWYWSSSQDINGGAWAQRFSDGYQYDDSKFNDSSLRCVR
jgi:hypothetical protein